MASITRGASGTGRMPASLLGAWLEAATEPAGLVTGGTDLKHRHGTVEVDPAPAQPGQLAKAQAGTEQGKHVIPPEQREAGQ